MNSKQRKTLKQIFENPVRSDIRWDDIESMLIALDAEVTEGSGSRVRVYLKGVRASFHRPHPEKVTNKLTVRDMRDFLLKAGIES